MKTETYRARWEQAGKMIDFERFACKRLDTVIKKVKALEEEWTYKRIKAEKIVIYKISGDAATPVYTIPR